MADQNRSVAFAAHHEEERRPLLHDTEHADTDTDGYFSTTWGHDGDAANPHADLPVYTTIHRYRIPEMVFVRS